jgi:putative oxidoreductase
MNKFSDLALLLLRIGTGFLLIANHGYSKLIGAYGYVINKQPWRFVDGVAELGFPFPTFFAVGAALIESIGALLVIIGLFTRYAAALIMVVMSVAIYRHLSSDFRYELAAMYLLVGFTLVCIGAGRYSVDAKRRR